MDANTHALNSYLSKLEADDRIEAAMERHIKELMDFGCEYDPYEPQNFFEAISELPVSDANLISGLFRLGMKAEASEELDKKVLAYWWKLAENKAEEYVKTCHKCYGFGCPRCEEP